MNIPRAFISSVRPLISREKLPQTFGTAVQLCFLTAISIFNFYVFNTPKISTGNSAARVLLAVGTPFHIGVPYLQLFEYVPPGLLISISTWIDLFGSSMISFRMLHASLIFFTGIFLMLILRRTLRFWLAETVIFVSMIITIFSQVIQSDIFSIELFGVFFALAGLTAILYFREPISQMALGSGLLLAASQIKETYTLCAATMLVVYGNIWRKRSSFEFAKLFLLSLYGPVTVVILIVSYIVLHGAIDGYIFVLHEKVTLVQHVPLSQVLKNLREVVIYYPTTYLDRITILWELAAFSVVILLQALVLRIFVVKKFWPIDPLHVFAYIATFLFSFGILGGFMIYGQISPGIRMLSVGISLFLLLGLVVSPALKLLTESVANIYIRTLFQLILGTLLIYFLLPNYMVLRDYRMNIAPPAKYDYFVENKIMQRVSPDECILHIYGWEVPQTYIYTRRKPCSRFFLANLVVGRPNRVKIYQDEIVANPPAAIIYNTGGSDMNVGSFEAEVVNFTEVIKKCYVLDPSVHQYFGYFFAPVDLYWKKDGLSQSQLRQCFIDYGVPKVVEEKK